MTGEPEIIELEASGETIGEAKWQALRELERLHPGLDRDKVAFEVLAEGERGLLGVGTAPARVLARAELAADAPASRSAGPEDTSLAGLVYGVVARITDDLGVRGRVEVTDGATAVVAVVSGPEIGLLIGRNGKTIDAVQHVLSAIAQRAEDPGGRRVEVDAGGYRARRRARLESTARQAADRVLATGSPVALEAMSSLERKLVHNALQDLAGVETRSEGEDPNRYVIVEPAGLSNSE
jgi:spoIIIJ-associated protein